MYQGWVGLIKAAEPDMPANTWECLIQSGFPLSGLHCADSALSQNHGVLVLMAFGHNDFSQTWVKRWREDATVARFHWNLFVRGSAHCESFPVSFSILSFCNEGPLSLNGSCVLSCSVSCLSFPIHSSLLSEWTSGTGKHSMPAFGTEKNTLQWSFILLYLLCHILIADWLLGNFSPQAGKTTLTRHHYAFVSQ